MTLAKTFRRYLSCMVGIKDRVGRTLNYVGALVPGQRMTHHEHILATTNWNDLAANIPKNACGNCPNFPLKSRKTTNQQHARALERSRLLADVIDREQRVIDDGNSALLTDLTRTVAVSTEKEANAMAVARRAWWAEARESLLSLFVSAHDSHQSCKGSRLPPSPRSESGNGGNIVIGADAVDNDPAPEATLAAVASSLPLIRARLDEMLRAEEARAAKATGDILATGDAMEAGSGREREEQGSLHLAVAEKQRLDSEAIGRCLVAVEAARSGPFASGGKRDQQTRAADLPAEDAATASPRQRSGISDGGGDEGRSHGTRDIPEQEMDLFLNRLEAGAVQLAAASFEAEVRLLAIGPVSPPTAAAEAMASCPPPPETTAGEAPLSLPSEHGPPGELTRSQLDLRRTARVKAFVRALGEMLCRGREVLQQQTLQVTPRALTPCVDVLNVPDDIDVRRLMSFSARAWRHDVKSALTVSKALQKTVPRGRKVWLRTDVACQPSCLLLPAVARHACRFLHKVDALGHFRPSPGCDHPALSVCAYSKTVPKLRDTPPTRGISVMEPTPALAPPS